MAFVVDLELVTPDSDQRAPDFWSVSRDVYPGIRPASTDVMLVQALLIAYFMSPAGVRPDLKAKAMAIISRFGKRFDDGIYGENTRAVMSLFEEDTRAPFKDGIVRTLGPTERVSAAPQTKLKRLNFVWNMTMLSDTLGATKKETGRRAPQPVLFREMYGS
jgi:hypothetical protein